MIQAAALLVLLGTGGEEAAAREAAELARSGPSIEAARKADGVVAVVDSHGRPVRGAALRIDQIASDFLFGGNIYLFDRCKTPGQAQAYRDRFAELFNYATTDFYWKYYEPERGKPRYAHTDAIVEWCAARGIRIKGHPIFWNHAAGVSDWSRGPDAAEVERARVRDLLGRYRGKIHSWDVVNEPAHAPRETELPFRWAREEDPRAELVINDYEVLDNGYPKFYELVEALLARGTPIDAVGIQGHFPLHTRFPLDEVRRHLDRYARLGKPLHITELAPPSGGQEILGSHVKGVWDEAAQADYVEKLYRVLFAHPAVAAITWWDVSDLESWQKGAGLLRADMSPKPAYAALRRLILGEWRTRLAGVTGADGTFRFRGFTGRYVASSGEHRVEFTLRKGGLNAVRLMAGPAAGR